MDLTIQSLVQSPFMRAMAVVPTRSEELVHGIHDHLPPLVKQKIRVSPVANAGKAGRWLFNIPRNGYWHRATLHVRPVVSGSWKLANMSSYQTDVASTFVEAVQNIELFSKQRFIERVVPEAIHHEMCTHTPQFEQWYQFTHAQYNPTTHAYLAGSVAFPSIGNIKAIGSLEESDGSSSSEARSRPHYIIPIPLASFTSVKRNLQTLFVEPLTLVVTTKDFGYATISGYEMMLECEYHQYHPNVETVIRNANYKQGIPATLPWHDWIHFDNQITKTASKIEYSLESDALVSTLIICPQHLHNLSQVKTTIHLQDFYVVVRSLSEVLFEGALSSLNFRYDLVLNETDHRHYYEKALDPSYKFYYAIEFGLTRDHERFSGGLALSSMTNPTISIYPNEQVYRGAQPVEDTAYGFPKSTATYPDFDFKILGKRQFFLRIDSDTGVITRSIES